MARPERSRQDCRVKLRGRILPQAACRTGPDPDLEERTETSTTWSSIEVAHREELDEPREARVEIEIREGGGEAIHAVRVEVPDELRVGGGEAVPAPQVELRRRPAPYDRGPCCSRPNHIASSQKKKTAESPMERCDAAL